MEKQTKKIKERYYLIERILAPVDHILRNKPVSGILLFVAVLISMIWINSSYAESYHTLWATHFKVGFGDFMIDKDLHHWINDGLMAIFFFVIGLEIKREIMAGDLSTWKQASLPAAAAVGGMVVPAIIFYLINKGTPTVTGWGVPMATEDIFILSLEYGAGFLVILAIANMIGVRKTAFYGIVGILGVWVAFLYSGIHATIAGVLIAMTIPSKTKLNRFGFITRVNILMTKLGETQEKKGDYLSDEQHHIVEKLKKERSKIEPPLQKLEHALSPFVSFIVLPIFALANAGVVLHTEMFADLTNQVSLGIILGLVLGKFLGIISFSALFVKFKISELPKGVSWGSLSGAAVMAGIGFTMSIFISELAFDSAEVRAQAKMAILIASIIAGLIGMLLIQYFSKRTYRQAATMEEEKAKN
mgnify:CR=1 FL=1